MLAVRGPLDSAAAPASPRLLAIMIAPISSNRWRVMRISTTTTIVLASSVSESERTSVRNFEELD